MQVGENKPIKPNPDAPWALDKLNRKWVADNLTHLVRSISRPVVLSINGPWGYGKTSFINMWRADLERQGHVCIYFNAWQNDLSRDPLISFSGALWAEMAEKLEGIGKAGTAEQQAKKLLDSVTEGAANLAANAIPIAAKLASGGLVDTAALKKPGRFEYYFKEKIRLYRNELQVAMDFRERLSRFAEVMCSKKIGYHQPIVVFVDELDRCRPTYSVELLEAIKHLFAVEGMVFVLSIDRKQIGHTVRQMFGSECDVDGYLKRFIDLPFDLPQPSTREFCRMLKERMALQELADQMHRGRQTINEIDKDISGWAELLGMTPREIERCFDRVNIILRTTTQLADEHIALLYFLAALQSTRSDLYQEFISNDRITSDLFVEVWGSAPMGDFYFDSSCSYVESTVYLAREGQTGVQERLSEVEAAIKAGGLSARTQSRMHELIDSLRSGMHRIGPEKARHLYNRVRQLLEFADQFQTSG